MKVYFIMCLDFMGRVDEISDTIRIAKYTVKLLLNFSYPYMTQALLLEHESYLYTTLVNSIHHVTLAVDIKLSVGVQYT